jgi:hypothetical protein
MIISKKSDKFFCVFYAVLFEELFPKRVLLLKNGPEYLMNVSIVSPFCFIL